MKKGMLLFNVAVVKESETEKRLKDFEDKMKRCTNTCDLYDTLFVAAYGSTHSTFQVLEY